MNNQYILDHQRGSFLQTLQDNILMSTKKERLESLNKMLMLDENILLLEEVKRQLEISTRNGYIKFIAKVQSLLNEMQLIFLENQALNIVDIDRRVNELLFLIYLEAYIVSRKTANFFKKHHSILADDIARCIEVVLVGRIPEIQQVILSNGVNDKSLVNRILWYIGEAHPELAKQTLHHLRNIDMYADNAKKIFTNTGKLLGRLGTQGFAASSAFFKPHAQATYIKKSDIKSYYDESVQNSCR